MKNFDWTQFTRKIAIKASVKSLYKAWTVPDELELWFLSEATYIDTNDNTIFKTQSIKKGYSYQWQWYLYPKTETGKVFIANGKDHVQFSFAGNCTVDVVLEPYEKGTIVSVTQKYIPIDDDSKVNVRLGCDNGWSFYLVNLKSVYEGGLDLRNKDANLKMMFNN
jgi:uncharacterized protein YndB with AHSA1/START domain